MTMTAKQPTPYEEACYVQSRLEAELGPGGSLHNAVSDLVSEAEGIMCAALRIDAATLAAAVDDNDWWNHQAVADRLGVELAETMFGIAKAMGEAARPTAAA